MSLTACLVSAVVAASSPQIQLPPNPRPKAAPQEVQRPVAEVERFRRDLQNLRGTPAQTERAMQQLAQDYGNHIEALVIERLRPALQRELLDLMLVARRFGVASPRIADEIMFQLLARPLGDATREVVDTMVALKGNDARRALGEVIHGRIPGARRVAAEAYARLATADDLDFALELAGDPALDLQLAGVQLLAAVPAARARERLGELLARDPSLAGAACAALIGVGSDAVPVLQQLLRQPAIDRAFPYAAFALVAVDRGQGKVLPPTDAVPALASLLRGSDALSRALAAIALAELAFRGQAAAVADADIVAALLDVGGPQTFVPNLDLVRRPAEAKLQQLTGRTLGKDALPWRQWWQDAKNGFVGMRARIDVDAQGLGAAIVTLRDDRRLLRLLGEDLADLPVHQGAIEYVLAREQMQQLVAELQAQGFMAGDAAPLPDNGLPPSRQLQLQLKGGRAQLTAPAAVAPVYDRLAQVVQQTADRELWQQLRHPVDEPERAAFWRAERRWQQQNTEPKEQDRRFLRRATHSWPLLGPGTRGLVLARLLAMPERRDLLAEEDGLALLALVRAAPKLGEQEQLLLELAAVTPGDRVWRECVDAAWNVPGGGHNAVSKVFAVLGADRVLAALGDERADVRRAAIEEVVHTRDLRAGGHVLGLFDDADPAVRQSAIYAAGQLELAAARVPLVGLIVADDTPPLLRREALHALGRVGGEGVFHVLQTALGAPVPEDRDAALRGLGELRDGRAAAQLAEIFAAGPATPNGELARTYLQRMGHKLAVPALRTLLQTGNPEVRNQVVLMLGAYQDPQVIPDLIAMLRQQQDTLAAASLLSCTIGLDVAGEQERVASMERWWRNHRIEAQWQWLLAACKIAEVKTSLEAAQFAPGAGLQPVPELARLMVEAEPARMRVLAAAVLRTVTGEDYGRLDLATPVEVRESIAARYRVLYESARAAQGR